MRKRWAIATILVLAIGLSAGAAVAGQYRGFPTVRLVINGRQVESDVPPLVMDGRTMLPVRPIADALGLQVNWDASSNTVSLTGGNASGPSGKSAGFASITTQQEFNSFADQSLAQLSAYQGIVLVYAGGVIVTDPASFFDFAHDTITVDELMSRSKVVDVPAKSQNATSGTSPTASSQSGQVTSTVGTSSKIQVVGQDKQFLGYLTSNEYGLESICNKYGNYGSAYSLTSIFNEYGQYGSAYSSKSAFNDYATEPPMLVQDGKVIGYLTTNKYKQGAISPLGICQTLKEMGL